MYPSGYGFCVVFPLFDHVNTQYILFFSEEGRACVFQSFPPPPAPLVPSFNIKLRLGMSDWRTPGVGPLRTLISCISLLQPVLPFGALRRTFSAILCFCLSASLVRLADSCTLPFSAKQFPSPPPVLSPPSPLAKVGLKKPSLTSTFSLGRFSQLPHAAEFLNFLHFFGKLLLSPFPCSSSPYLQPSPG